jgi:protein involved in polysaccharide export with SLBB domain
VSCPKSKRTMFFVVVFLCFFGFWGSLPAEDKKAQNIDSQKQEYPPFVIGPGDLLSIYVYGEKDLPTDFLVDATGSIIFPMISEVKLLGLSQGQASKELADHLKDFVKVPQVTVLIKESNTYRISVIGQVARPGKYIVRGRPTLVSVLSEAGGPLDNANYSRATLIRGNVKTRINLNTYLRNTSDRQEQPLLFPGDTLLVPKNPWPTIGEWGIITGIITSAILISASLQK